MTYYKHKLYIGIDIHSREHKAALVPIALLEGPDVAWRKVKPLNIKNDIADFERLDAAIRSYIASTKEALIAVDHTGGHYSEPLVHFLQMKGYTVYHLETKAVKAARERLLDQESKSDVIDATSAAFLLYLRDVHGLSFRISAMTPELGSKAAALNALVLHRLQFSKLATQATNRLHQFLLAVFPEGEARYFKQLLKITPNYPTPGDILASNGLEAIEGLHQKDKENILELAANTVGVPGQIYQWLIRDLSYQRMEALAKCDTLTIILRSEVETHPYGDILLSFPHIGAVAAATIIAIIKDIDRWPDKKKLKKALGVYSSLKQSGTSLDQTRQGKEGSRHGRRVLFQVCFGCIRTNVRDNDFKDYYLRQVARDKPRMKALVSTMGKLAEIIYHCLKAGEPYQYQGIYRTNTISTGKKS
jgi:transposase